MLGSFDIDPNAISTSEYLALRGRMGTIADASSFLTTCFRATRRGRSGRRLRQRAVRQATKLIADELANTEHYQKMNELMLVWTQLMLDTLASASRDLNVPNALCTARNAPSRRCFEAHATRAGYLVTHEITRVGRVRPEDGSDLNQIRSDRSRSP